MNSASSPTPLRLRLAPAIISGLLIAAHFLHAGSRPLALLGIAFPLLLLAKRPWAVRIVQVLLLLCAVEWLRTVVLLAAHRYAFGQPFTRLVVILAVVTLITVASAIPVRGKATPPSGVSHE